MDKIQIPPTFIREHKKMLAKTCIIKTDEGMSWTAKIVKEGSNYFICGGDWPQFVAYHNLELGDLIVFLLIHKSMFQILPYNKNCCGSLLARQVFDELSSEEEEEDIQLSRNTKKAKIEPRVLSNAKEENIDPSCGIKEGESPCYLHSGSYALFKMLTTLSDIIRLLGSHFSVDLMHRKAEAKAIVTDVIGNMIDEEESVDPSRDGENPCYAESGGDKSDDKVDNMLGVEKKAPGLKE